MKLELVVNHSLWEQVRQNLCLSGKEEKFLFGLAHPMRIGRGRNSLVRFELHEVRVVSEAAYRVQGSAGLTLTDEVSSFFNLLSVEAARVGCVPVHIHSHPRGIPSFSGYDDRAERQLHEWLARHGQPWLLSMVQSPDEAPRARLWRSGSPYACGLRIGLRRLEKAIEMKPGTGWEENGSAPVLPALDRQRAFGSSFAHAAARLRVGIVGTGGVGMPVAEMLARSGVTDFVLVDPDLVEEVNLNRLGHADRRDIGRTKVSLCSSIISRACRAVGTRAKVKAYAEDVNLLGSSASADLALCDVLLALTDDELSRIACLDIALRNGLEYLQAGVGIFQENGRITSVAVEFTGAEEGRYCPLCSGRLSSAQASIDARRYVGGEVLARARAEGYIADEPAPSVMSLNAVAAGALVLEIQKRIAGVGEGAVDLWQHDFVQGKLMFETHIERKLDGPCAVCGRLRAPESLSPDRRPEHSAMGGPRVGMTAVSAGESPADCRMCKEGTDTRS